MFAETFYINPNRRRFRVNIQDVRVRNGLDIYGEVLTNFAYILSSKVVVGATNSIKIAFENVLENAKINAIEIIPLL